MKPETTKPLVTARQTAEATVSTGNTNQIPTTLGPQLEDPQRVATAKAVPAVLAVASEVVVVAAVVVAATAEINLTTLVEELVAAAITEAKAMRTATSPLMHVVAATLAIKSTRSAVKMLLKQVTATASQPIPRDFATCFFLRN
jgi:hypothetical protein